MKRNNMRKSLIGILASMCIIPLVIASAISCNSNNISSQDNINNAPIVNQNPQNPPSQISPDHQPDNNNSQPSLPNPPTPNPEPANNMLFKINVKRSSGFKFNRYDPYFEIINADTNQKIIDHISDYDDGENDWIVNVKLPEDGNYKINVVTTGPYAFGLSTYTYTQGLLFNKENPVVDFIFTPHIVDGPKEGNYKFGDVSHELPYLEDVLGNHISLKDNEAQGKATILMYMRTTCQRSKNSLNAINKAVAWDESMTTATPENWNKISVICFSDVDSVETLRDFQQNHYENFHFVSDKENKFRNKYFPNDTGYPKLVFLDYQAVIIHKITNELSQDTGIPYVRSFMNDYSKRGK